MVLEEFEKQTDTKKDHEAFKCLDSVKSFYLLCGVSIPLHTTVRQLISWWRILCQDIQITPPGITTSASTDFSQPFFLDP